MQQIAAADTAQMFLDWGRPALLEDVQSYYDPETGQMEESVLFTSLQVIASPVKISRREQTTATHAESRQMLVVRAVELPEAIDLLTARIQLGTQRFQIQSIETSHIPETVALECCSLSA